MEDAETLAALLDRRASEALDSPALVDSNGQAFSYAELERLSRRTAAWLTAQGLSKGDRVAVWLVNRVEWLGLLYGASRLGVGVVAVNTRYRGTELQHILERSGASMLVLDAQFRKIDFLSLVQDVDPDRVPDLRRVAILERGTQPDTILGRKVVRFDVSALSDGDPREDGSPDDLAVLFSTSGTTKLPKLVMHTQRTLSYHTRHLSRAFGFTQGGARLLGALPLCGVFGLNPVLAALAGGATVYLMETFDGKEAVELIRRHAITHAFGSDEMFRRMLENAPEEMPMPAARIVGYAALQAGASELARAAWSRGVPMTGMYGSSEVNALFSKQPDHLPLDERIKAGGVPISAEARVRIRDPDTGELLPAGQSGIIEIRAPSNFIGYWNDPDATAKVIDSEGFYRTGDMGMLREDGSFVYEARIDDAMRLSGFLVNPGEIEDVLKEIEGVDDAQVISVTLDGKLRCAAFIIPAPGASPDPNKVIAEAGRLMATFKVPARVWIVEQFPVTESANGMKIQRALLRKMAAERLEKEKCGCDQVPEMRAYTGR